MKLADIPRVKAGTAAKAPVLELAELDQERLYLGTRVKDLLGYGGLQADVTGERLIGATEGKLTECLRTLDIPVLDTAAVIEYQLEELTRLNREVATERFEEWAAGYFSPAAWHKTNINAYKQAIPEGVLDKAVRIKERLPEVEFYVQHLSEPKADPFLVAVSGSYNAKEIFYVEAWDEPRFEGRKVR